MKKAMLLMAGFLLVAGCNDRENPLTKQDPKAIHQWLLEHRTPAMTNCASFWASPGNASSDQLDSCEPEKKALAGRMNSSAFATEEILPEDLALPAIWISYVAEMTRIEERMEQRKSRQDERRKIWGGK